MECCICNSKLWETVLEVDQAVCSGREIVKGTLMKGMCGGCGFVWAFCSPLDSEEAEYYHGTYSSKLRTKDYDYINYGNNKTFTQAQSDFVLSHAFPAQGTMLDIGCGKGTFMKAFLERYPTWDAFGVDPNKESIKLAENEVPCASFRMKNFGALDYQVGSFDLICLHAILDRVNPWNMLIGATSLLKSNGILSIEIPILPEVPAVLYFADHTCSFFREHLLALMEHFLMELVAEDCCGPKWRFLFRRNHKAETKWNHILKEKSGEIRGKIKEIGADWGELFNKILDQESMGRRLAFYGHGTMLALILNATDFPGHLITGIYDDNPHKIGEVIKGVKVKALDSSIESADSVVLCSGGDTLKHMKKKLEKYKCENLMELC